MDYGNLLQMILRLIFAALLGGMIGWERERHDRPAGLRTHILVCVGSALITIISIYGFVGSRTDPARVAANIVTGIGFLGAGTIIRQGSIIRGLTTAASLWVVSAVGMAAGVGGSFYVIALLATLLIYLTLTVVNRLEDTMMSKRQYRDLVITGTTDPRVLSGVLDTLEKLNVMVKSIQREPVTEEGHRLIRLGVRIPPGVRIDAINRDLVGVPEIVRIEWE